MLAEAVERARADGDRALEARARVERELVRLAGRAGRRGRPARRVADAALAELARHGDERGQRRAWRLRAWIEWTAGRAAAADDAWRRPPTHARRAGDERELFEIARLARVGRGVRAGAGRRGDRAAARRSASRSRGGPVAVA